VSVRGSWQPFEAVESFEATRLVERLLAAYPQAQAAENTRSFYAHYLLDLDAVAASEAVDDLILDSTTLPTIAEIRRRVIEKDVELPTALEAWASVVERPTGRETVEMHPLAREVCNLFGGSYTIRNSDQPTIMRAQFLKAYDERRDEELRRQNVGRFRRRAA
jgi:hypothetical protein